MKGSWYLYKFNLIEDLCGKTSVVGYILLYLDIKRVFLVTPQNMCGKNLSKFIRWNTLGICNDRFPYLIIYKRGKNLEFLNLYNETQMEHGMTDLHIFIFIYLSCWLWMQQSIFSWTVWWSVHDLTCSTRLWGFLQTLRKHIIISLYRPSYSICFRNDMFLTG